MTDPIQRSGRPPLDPPSSPLAGAEGPKTDAFREALVEGAAGPAGAGPAAGPSAATSDLQRLAEDVRAGRMTPEAVIEALVARQLTAGPAMLLAPAQRAQLEALLRSRLADDPTLLAMGQGLARAATPGTR
jgi:hypothetical protein